MEEILEQYNLDNLIEAVEDRVTDYQEHVEFEYEAPSPEEEEDIYFSYRHGLGEDLRRSLALLKQLKNYQMQPKKFLIVVDEEFTSAGGMYVYPEGYIGGEEYIEFPDPMEVVIGIYENETENKAIEEAATFHGVSAEALKAYRLL